MSGVAASGILFSFINRLNHSGQAAPSRNWALVSARVSRALVGLPPTSRGGNFQHRLVLSQEPLKPSAGYVFRVVAARATERGLESAGVLVSEGPVLRSSTAET